MSLDFPATGSALWSLSDATGLRPEYLLPVFYLESGFNPAVVNSIGCVGLAQECGQTPAGYASWAASQQIAGVIGPRFKADIATYGPIGSATKAYLANLLPAALPTATSLSSILAQRGSSVKIPKSQLTQGQVYAANAGLDANGDGAITVADLAAKMRQMLSRPAVQQAIAQTYALRPGSSPVADPAYGTDFSVSSFWEKALITAAALTVAGAVAVAVYDLAHERPLFAALRS